MQNSGIEVLFNWQIIWRLVQGLAVNIEISFLAILLTVILGTFFGVVRTVNNKFIYWFFRLYLEIIRILPPLVLLFVLYFTLPTMFDIEISGTLIGIVAFTIWGAAEMSDIVRAAIISLPKHQTDAALAIGLNSCQLYCYVLLPQSIKRILPACLNLAVRIIMTSALLVLIGVREIIKVGKEIIEFNAFNNPLSAFWIYGFILLIFFLICYPLARVAKKLEKKWS